MEKEEEVEETRRGRRKDKHEDIVIQELLKIGGRVFTVIEEL